MQGCFLCIFFTFFAIKMNSFQSEISSFIGSVEPIYTIENWGVLIEARGIGFIFHELSFLQKPLDQIPDNLHIIHLWEDHWTIKKDIVKSRITSLLGKSKRVFARNTTIVKLNKIELLEFLNKNHLNEPVIAKHKYGLMAGDELVAVSAFSTSCPVHRQGVVYRSHQLVRFCNKNGITIVGGLSKLISHFIKMHDPEDIMSYADLDWSNGKSYLRLGFEKIGELAPQPFVIDPATMVRNYKPHLLIGNKKMIHFSNQGSTKFLLDLKKNGN